MNHPVIIANIVGGLGNQMFQYACGRAVRLRTEHPLRIATDQFFPTTNYVALNKKHLG